MNGTAARACESGLAHRAGSAVRVGRVWGETRTLNRSRTCKDFRNTVLLPEHSSGRSWTFFRNTAIIRNMKQLDSGTVGKSLGAIIAAGEPIQITRYGKVVAVLTPVAPAPPLTVDVTDWPTAGVPASPDWTPERAESVTKTKTAQTARDQLLGKIGHK